MKTYPSIKRATGKSFQEVKLHTFDKIDGSNIRAAWNKKRGWYKFGTRKRLLDETDEVFGGVVNLFRETLGEPLGRIARDEGWQSVVVFCEFWGPSSFAGLHVPDEPKKLTVIDVAPYKKGILQPKDFLDLFEEYGPTYLGKINWTRGFIERVKNDDVDGITFEGVVGKIRESFKSNRIIMYKAKTNKWIQKVYDLYDNVQAEKIVNS